jgi:hypothetical protein
MVIYYEIMGHACGGAVGLRHCLTSCKVVGSIRDGVIVIFHRHNPNVRTMILGLTQPPNRNEYQESSLGGKGGRCVGLTNLPHSCASCLEIWGLILLEPSGPVQACNGIALPYLILK